MTIAPVRGAVRGALLMGALFYMVAWFRLHPTHRVDALRGWSLLDLVGNEPTAGGTAGASAEHSATTSTVAQARSPGDGDGAAFAINLFAVSGADRELPGSAGDAQPPCASEPALLTYADADGSMRTAQAGSLSDGNGVAATGFAVITAIGGADREHVGGANDA